VRVFAAIGLAAVSIVLLLAALRLRAEATHRASPVPSIPAPVASQVPCAPGAGPARADRVGAAPVTLATAAAPAVATTPSPQVPSPQERALEKGVDARLADRSLLDILEMMRAESATVFQYDPELMEKFSKMRITLDITGADMKTTLDFLKDFAEFDVEYMSDRVVFRKKSK